jgi:ubiquinone/menaquinone biosynthesis C-methylase UbiE
MSTNLNHPDAVVRIKEVDSATRRIRVEMRDPSIFSPRTQWLTRYSLDLIEAVLEVKGPAYLCDEIARDEDPAYVESDLLASLFAYVDKEAMGGKTLLDFGCGSGASTMVVARTLPNCHIVGVELDERVLALARRRAKYYGFSNLTLLQSPAPDALPERVGSVDFVLLSAVYEHLLPSERPKLLRQMWRRLNPGGVLFVNQTPDRRFPIETHTTGLPFINYLPDSVAFYLARKFSKRGLGEETWESLLRAGIRGATPAELRRILSESGCSPELLNPISASFKRQSDIWYHSAKQRLSLRYDGLRRRTVLAVMQCILWTGIPVAPYISLALKKVVPNIFVNTDEDKLSSTQNESAVL